MQGLHIVVVPAWWPSPEQPGAGVFFCDYARAFAAAGARVGVVFPDLVSVRHLGKRTAVPWVPRLLEEDLDGVPVVRVRGWHTAFGRPWIQMHRFRRWLRRGLDAYTERCGAPDILHAMCAIPSGWACTHLHDQRARPTVITELTGPFSLVMTPRAGASYVRAALRRAASVAAVSDHLRADMRSAGIDREIGVCDIPVSDEFVSAPLPDRRRPGPMRALFVGRLVREKGLIELCAAAERMPDDPAVEWHFAGDGPLAGDLRERFAESGRQTGLRLHGHCDRATLIRLMADSDFLVLPTHGETFGMAVVESLCMGLPVITTRGTSCGAFVDAASGLLVERGDVEALVGAIGAMVGDPARFDRVPIARRARVRFSASAVASWYADVFRRVLAAHDGGGHI